MLSARTQPVSRNAAWVSTQRCPASSRSRSAASTSRNRRSSGRWSASLRISSRSCWRTSSMRMSLLYNWSRARAGVPCTSSNCTRTEPVERMSSSSSPRTDRWAANSAFTPLRPCPSSSIVTGPRALRPSFMAGMFFWGTWASQISAVLVSPSFSRGICSASQGCSCSIWLRSRFSLARSSFMLRSICSTRATTSMV